MQKNDLINLDKKKVGFNNIFNLVNFHYLNFSVILFESRNNMKLSAFTYF
jgi:hypothetical protein